MIRSVIDVGLDADDRISAEGTGFHCILNARVNCRDIFLRDGTACCCVLELIQILTVRVDRRKDDLAVTVLAGAAGLLSVLVLLVDLFGECLLVGNLRSAYIGLNMELAQTVS